MDRRMFDGLISGLLIIGVALWLALAIYWLCSQISIAWGA